MFLHIDMDAFFASVEQAVNPRLRGKPLIVGGRQGRFRTVVCAASYEAKALGIDSGMSSFEAFRLCPNLEFVVADSAKYIYTTEKIFEILKEFSPQVEQSSIDEFVLETEGLAETPEMIALKIKEEIRASFGITCSVGIAKTRLLAKLASKLNKPDGLVILQEKDLASLFKKTPVEKLCGVGPSLKTRLNSLSIITCLDLFNAPKELLFEHFGKVGLWLYEALRSNKDVAVSLLDAKEAPPKSIGHSYTLPQEISEKRAILGWIRLLSEMVGLRLRQQNLEAQTLYLYLVDSRHFGISQQKTFDLPTFDGYEIFQRCRSIIKASQKRLKSVRALGVSASNLALPQRPYLFPIQSRREALIKSLDQINAKFGDWTVFPAAISPISSQIQP